MIDTFEYRFQGGWREVIWILRHPIIAIREDSNAFPTHMYRIKQAIKRLYIRLPFQKPCRWLASMLINRTYDTKLLDTFWCRTYGKTTIYYKAIACFGYIHFLRKIYKRDGKTVNLFMDFTVGGLVDSKEATEKAKRTSTETTTIYRGFVFTKKKAYASFKKIMQENKDIFYGEYAPDPTVYEQSILIWANQIHDVLHKGTTKHLYFDDLNIEEGFKSTNDKIEKLYYYMLQILTTPNNFDVHWELASIFTSCSMYMYWQEVNNTPLIDECCRKYLDKGDEKGARDYLNHMLKLHSKKKIIEQIDEKIEELKEKAAKQEFGYYRV